MASSDHIQKLQKENVARLTQSVPLTLKPHTFAKSKPKPFTSSSSQKFRSDHPVDPSQVPLPASPDNTASEYPGFHEPKDCDELECSLSGLNELNDLPRGFPYTDWNGALCFAWEYLRNMQKLVMELMEGNGRYHGLRHTT